MSEYAEMPLYKLKKAAKEAGVKCDGLDKDGLIAALEGGSKSSKAPAKGSKGASAKGGKAVLASKGSKGGKAATEEEPEVEEVQEKGSKGAKGAKGTAAAPKKAAKSSKKDDDDELTVESVMEAVLALRSDFEDFIASFAAAADKPSKEAKSKRGAKTEPEEEADEEGSLEAALVVLKDHLDDEGNVSVELDDIAKFNSAKLDALADFLGSPRPAGGLAAKRAEMAAAYKEALGEDEEEEEEGTFIEVEYDGDTLEIEPVAEEIFDAKFWKKGGAGHGRTLFVMDDGVPVPIEISKVGGPDKDGDHWLVGKSETGDDYSVYYFGVDGGTITALGFLKED